MEAFDSTGVTGIVWRRVAPGREAQAETVMREIKSLARQAGLRPSAIRYYESAGLLPAPVRVSGWRCYDGSARTRLAVIELAKLAGFTLAETRILLRGFSPRTPPSARWHKLARAMRRYPITLGVDPWTIRSPSTLRSDRWAEANDLTVGTDLDFRTP